MASGYLTQRIAAIEEMLVDMQKRLATLEARPQIPSAPQPGARASLVWAKPAPGAAVVGMLDLELRGANLSTVEIFHMGARIKTATADPTGTLARAVLDTALFEPGPLTLSARSSGADAGELTIIVMRSDEEVLPAPALLTESAAPQTITSPLGKTRHLFFHDEFDGVANHDMGGRLYPDTTKWKTTLWDGARTVGVEAQTYVDPYFRGANGNLPPTAAFCPFEFRDSVLSLVARPVPRAYWANWWMDERRPLASGLLCSDGKANGNFQYGYMEARLRLPRGIGAAPAWHLRMNRNNGIGTDPALHADDHATPPEIVMMAALPYLKATAFSLALHADNGVIDMGLVDREVDLTNEFHTFGFEWDAHDIVATLDGEIVSRDETPPALRVSMYMLLHLAVGGESYEKVVRAPTAWAEQPTYRFEADFVRVYR